MMTANQMIHQAGGMTGTRLRGWMTLGHHSITVALSWLDQIDHQVQVRTADSAARSN